MKFGVFAIRDKKTCFMSPVIDQTDQSAVRNFLRAVNQPDTLMEFSPDDFDLYQIGWYDDQSGHLEPLDPVEFVVSGSSLVGVKYEK